jgi:hypothetical protein
MSIALVEKGAAEAAQPTDHDLIDKFLEIKAYVERRETELSEQLKPAREGMELIKNTILARLNARGAENTKTDAGTAYKSKILDVKVVGRAEFLAFCTNGNTDMLQVGAVKDEVKQYIAEYGTVPAGLETSTTIRINIRKS